MAMDAIQLMILLLLGVIHAGAVKPPGYVEPQKERDPSHIRYEYGYNVDTDKGAAEQGKQEERDGIYASGRYYVQGKDSSQDVRYFADDWGFHPAVEYSSAGPHSNSRARFALGFEAVQQLKNKENNQPQLQGLPETGNLNKQGPQVLLRRNSPTLQGHQPQDSQQQPLFLQVAGQKTPLVEENRPQPSSQLPTDARSPHEAFLEPQQQISIQQQPSQATNELQSTGVLDNAYTHEGSEQNLQNTRGNLIYPQQPGHLLFQHQQVLLFPNQHLRQQTQGEIENQSQENVYEQQKVNEVIETQNLDQQNFEEFGLKINPVEPNLSTKLIETTQHLVSGQDVLDINSAITKQHETIAPSTAQYSTVHQESNQDNSQVTYVSTTPCSPTKNSFIEQPIVVADYDEAKVQFSTSTATAVEETETFSTTAKPIESISTTYESPTTIVVTPRPISTQFLAPITAGIRLQNIEQHEDSEQQFNKDFQIQESIPYYLGKYEYPAVLDKQVGVNISSEDMAGHKAEQNLELGKTLLLFPELPQAEALVQRPFNEVDNHLTSQQLPNSDIKYEFQQNEKEEHLRQQDHQQYREDLQQGVSGYDAEKLDSSAVHFAQNLPDFTRVIHQPYSVRVPYEVPYPVVKQVSVPVTVQRVVEKPVHITKYVEKPVPVPQPYPVERVVEKPVHIPVQVTRYIDRPYPVEVRVPYPQPYPVEKLVHKIIRQPYPVEVKVPYPVEKIVEKKIHVPHYIDKPVTIEKIVEKPVAHYVDRPYPVEIKVPVPQPFYVKVEVPRPHSVSIDQAFQRGLYQRNHEQNVQQSQQQTFFSNPYAYAPQINQYLPPRKQIVVSNSGYLPPEQFNTGYLPPQTADCNRPHPGVDSNNHIGLLPPRVGQGRTYTRTFRSARHFDDNSVRMEYGFMPPMVPSLEIDDQGNPVEKSDK